MDVVNPEQTLGEIDDHGNPRVVGEPNGQHVKRVKFRGEFLIVPRGVGHRPVAEEEVYVLLFGPASTLKTGDVREERTVEEPGRL